MIRSQDRRWTARVQENTDESRALLVESDVGALTIANGRPIAFTPDSDALIYVASEENLVAGLYALRLTDLTLPARRLTNVGVPNAAGPLPSSFVPPPIVDDVTWQGRFLVYSVPGDGLFRVNVDSGVVLREP